MPVPKRKTSKSRRDKRSANKGMKERAVAQCKTCQAPVRSHSVCPECGHYKGIKILRTKSDRLNVRSKEQEAQAVKQRAHQAVAQTPEEQPVEKK